MSADNNYFVTEEQKKLWRIELDLAKAFVEFCQEHSLKTYACYGTLLGAVRHKGFIPWDDDMDFVMMRDDYDKLLEIIKKNPKLPKGMVFDISSIKVIKLRNINTTMRLKSQKLNPKLNHGVWIDIFSLDTAPDDVSSVVDEYRKRNVKLRKLVNGTLFHYNFQPSLKYKIGHLYCRLFFAFNNSGNYRRKLEDLFRADRNRFSGKYVWVFLLYSTLQDIPKIKRMETSWFEDIVMMPFEDIVLPCPKEIDKILTCLYGDWQTPVVGTQQHEAVVDVNKPYTQYVKETLDSYPWWKRYWYKH